MNKDELRHRAILLEQALQLAASQSADVAAFAAYEPVVDAIRRAKAGEISAPEELPGLRYWLFETDIPAFPSVELALSRFSLLLQDWGA
jgi:hypothetical protein